MKFQVSLTLALILCLSGCASTPSCASVPQYLLAVPRVDTNRTIASQADAAELMLDLYEAYAKCAINLESIRKLNERSK
ncbi:hypothetical protein [uncultured Campylobacter sp.]|uniref:Rz1-like lysis system protein LysC n=1 Tax=uncultured Campylobacter sp. TaxID=218934 RepID=UPI00260BFCE5|nr:hypothetical protein [uncultured Campylobacter sp.]